MTTIQLPHLIYDTFAKVSYWIYLATGLVITVEVLLFSLVLLAGLYALLRLAVGWCQDASEFVQDESESR
jgi:uncharacterized membrane protein YcjF (UPF0283 family)